MAVFAAIVGAASLMLAGCAGDEGGVDLGATDEGEVVDPGEAVATCDCGTAACGLTVCGETCGLCTGGDATMCWGGECVSPDGCDVIGFTDPTACQNDKYCEPGSQAFAQAATTPSVGGGFKVKYVATVDDYSVTPDALVQTQAFEDGRPIAKKKIFLEIDHNAFFAEGEPRTGTWELGGDEAKEGCTLCLKAGSYCNDKGCGKDYVASSGTLEIMSSGEPGSPLIAMLRDVTFSQVYMNNVKDDGSYQSAGQSALTWCLGDFPISLDIPEPTQPVSDCQTEGSGVLLGDNIADYTLTNCLGEEVSLHSRCGRTKAVWVVAVAGW